MSKNKMLFGVVAGLCMSSAVSASTFHLTGLNGQNNSPSIDLLSSDGLISATASAGDDMVGAFSLDGLGVKGGCCDSRAIGDGETLRISFSQKVDVGELRLRQFEAADSLLLSWQGGSRLLDDGSASLDEFRLVGLQGVEWFSLTGQGFLTQAALAGVHDVSLSEVPIPAAAWLFGSALLGLAGVKRRC